MSKREWLIYNANNGQFWGPDSGGYFGLWGAGLYTEAEDKLTYTQRQRDGWIAVAKEKARELTTLQLALASHRDCNIYGCDCVSEIYRAIEAREVSELPLSLIPTDAEIKALERNNAADILEAVAEWFTECKNLHLETLPRHLIAACHDGASALRR